MLVVEEVEEVEEGGSCGGATVTTPPPTTTLAPPEDRLLREAVTELRCERRRWCRSGGAEVRPDRYLVTSTAQ